MNPRKAVSTTALALIVVVVILGAAIIYLYYTQTAARAPAETPAETQTTPTAPAPAPTGVKGTKLPYDSDTKTVFVTLETATTELVYNGTGKGKLVIYMPAGWTLELKYINLPTAGLPHSAGIVKNNTAVPKSSNTLKEGQLIASAPPGEQGFLLGMDPGETASLKAQVPEGVYWIACGVPGHTVGGMWIVLVSSPSVTEPYYVS